MIKRIQNTMIQMLTDAINLILIDTGNEAYINKFTLKMQAPTTQEEVDRRDNLSNKVGLVRDIMDTVADIENGATKLKIAKSLLSNTISDGEVIQLIQEEIEAMEAQMETESEPPVDMSTEGGDDYYPDDAPMDFGGNDSLSDLGSDEVVDDAEAAEGEEDTLPSPADLDVGDMSDSSNPELQS